MAPDDPIMQGPGERRVAEAAERIVAEGRPRLHRTWTSLVATSLLGGIDVGVGVMTLLYVRHATGSELLAGLAFSVGLIALLLGHSELNVPIGFALLPPARLRLAESHGDVPGSTSPAPCSPAADSSASCTAWSAGRPTAGPPPSG